MAAGLEQLSQIELENDVDIPIDALQHIDEGLNPEGFAKDLVDKCTVETEGVRGKVAALEVPRRFAAAAAAAVCVCVCGKRVCMLGTAPGTRLRLFVWRLFRNFGGRCSKG